MPHCVLSILKSAVIVAIFSSTVTFAGKEMFFVLSFKVRFPLIVWVAFLIPKSLLVLSATKGSTDVISNFAKESVLSVILLQCSLISGKFYWLCLNAFSSERVT